MRPIDDTTRWIIVEQERQMKLSPKNQDRLWGVACGILTVAMAMIITYSFIERLPA